MKRINLREHKNNIISLYLNEMKSTVQIGKEYSIHASTVERRLKEWGVEVRRMGAYKVNHDALEKRSREGDYWIGYIAGDGNVYAETRSNTSYRISVTSKDREHLVKMKSFFCSDHKIIEKPQGKIPGRTYCFRFSSNKIARTLIAYGIVPNKSKTMAIRDQSMLFSRDFIRGIVDSDGCLYKRTGTSDLLVTIATGSELFANQLSESIINLGIFTKPIYSRANKIYTVSIGRTRDAVKFCDIIGYGEDIVSLDRKKEIAKRYLIQQ